MRILFAIIFMLSISSQLSAQKIKDAYIVDLVENTLQKFTTEYKSQQRSVAKIKILSKDLNIILIQHDKASDAKFEKWLNENKGVESWGYDSYVKQRKSPNDDFYNKQVNLDILETEKAWDITTGGETANGDKIVVAVLDEGFDLNHPDLKDAIFQNSSEVAGDGIDNDNNGYIDDVTGWNSTDDNGEHPFINRHGIAVAGIIGAIGDNDIGLAGINWNVKILPITGIDKQSTVITGYQYAITMRQRYNETNGAEGAFIVATNYSAGINGAFGTDPQFKSWCDMYDAMAAVGILSTGATANVRHNIDTAGDIPTTCPSPFLLSVTNSTAEDTLYKNAAFSTTHIDLAAPGVDVWVLDKNNGYNDGFTGTSSATPHVAGTIALLYSYDCLGLANLALSAPEEAALIVKDAILNGAERIPALESRIVNGNRLNILNALKQMEESCMLLDNVGISRVKYGQNIFSINYSTPNFGEHTIMVTDAMGRLINRQSFVPPSVGEKVLQVSYGELPTGIYFISIYNEESISTKKIFIP